MGPSRSANSLHQALSQIDELSQDVARCMQVTGGTTRYNNELTRAFNLRVMLRVAEAVIRAALVREESRGHHFREDFPETDNEKWLRHTVVSGQNGCLRTSMCPVKRMNMEAGKGELS